MITLESIAFNHDTSTAHRDAISIRRNASTTVTVPEWRRGSTVAAADCPAAYSIEQTRGQTITVRATFRRDDASPSQFRVRTFNPNDTRAAGCLYAILEKLGVKFVWRPPPPVLNALGEVVETAVDFGGSDTVSVELPLRDTQIPERGVGVYYDTWHWQYRIGNANWTDFEVTNHKIYAVLDRPTAPWTQAAGSTELPWTDALDFACEWASGATTRDAVATAITKRIYDLGPSVIEYDCPGGGSSHYSWGHFDCSSFIDRLRGGPGLGRYVNCSDCATFVSTFANLVGCDLWQSVMGYSFDLYPIRGIGSSVWETACGWGGFNYHEVAWKDGCTESDPIFDACLQVDGDSNPLSAPHTPLLPTNIVFSTYRTHLVPQGDWGDCQAQTAERQRRALF